MMERNYDTSIDTYTPTMMGFELPYGFRFKRSRQVIDIIRTAICRVTRMVNPAMQHWSVFATVFAMATHFVDYTVSLWRSKVVLTSAGASRSVSSDAFYKLLKRVTTTNAIITYESLSDLRRQWQSSHENDLYA